MVFNKIKNKNCNGDCDIVVGEFSLRKPTRHETTSSFGLMKLIQ